MYCTDQAALTLPTANRNTEATSTDTTNPPVEQESTTWHKYDAGVGNWESDEGGWAPATVLGPRGMMPNPKVGTVTMDVTTAVANAKGGEVQFKVEKAGVIHAGIGKASFTPDALAQNVRAIVDAVAKAKPSGAKGAYMKKVSLSSTMGPGVTVDLASATGQ